MRKFTYFKVLVLLSILSVSIGCEKDKQTYEVRFVCESDNPYTLTVDGVSRGSVDGHTYKIIDLEEGTHTWSALQESGYILYPTEKSGDFILSAEMVVTFP
jgi:hypothetical protein